jgi:pilus assembly protein CpaB
MERSMRRIIAIIVAVALAGAGTFFLVRYIQGAEARALEGEVLVEVLVADQPIAAGTPAEELTPLVRLEQVPTKVAIAGVVSDLTPLAGKVTAIGLLPGEQLSTGRFIDLEAYQQTIGRAAIEVPPDTLQVTISLSPDRVIGGELRPGDLVAVFASFDPFALDTVEPTGLPTDQIPVLVPDQGTEEGTSQGAQTPNSTKLILRRALVTNLQAEELPRTIDADQEQAAAGAPELAPTGNLLITLALNPEDSQRLVFTAEFGTIWLALEGDEADTSDTPVQTRITIYEVQ